VDNERRHLSASEIMDAKDIETIDVDVPEWGGFVRLRALSGEDALKFVEMVQKDSSGAAMKIVALCAIDDRGEPLFSLDQVEQLKRKSMKALMRLQKEALRLNGLSEDAPAVAKND
jgi:hypothetical protein